MARLANRNPLLRAFAAAMFWLGLVNVDGFALAAESAGVDPSQMAAVKALFFK